MLTYNRTRRKSGFTIVELLIVIVVIGILAGITIVAYNGVQNRAKSAALQVDLENAQKSLHAFKVGSTASEQYPADLTVAALKASNGTTYQYTVDNTIQPADFCLTAKNETTSYFITPSSPPQEGNCFNTYRLVGWWPLNGNANDSTENGNNGIVSGAVMSTGQNEQANGAYTFAGGSNAITLPASAVLNSSVFTFAAWVRPTSYANNLTVIGGVSGYSPQLRIDNGKLTLLQQGASQLASSYATVPLDTWSYIGVTYNSVGNYTYYINGVPAGVNSSPTGTGTHLRTFTFNRYQIGRMNSPNEGFLGAIDDVRIYARVLSPDEMASLYASVQ